MADSKDKAEDTIDANLPDSTKGLHAPETEDSPVSPEEPKHGETPGTPDDSAETIEKNTESSGSAVLDALNAAAETVLGPPPRAADPRGGYVEDPPPAREVAAAHGDRLITTEEGEHLIIDTEHELTQQSDPDR